MQVQLTFQLILILKVEFQINNTVLKVEDNPHKDHKGNQQYDE